jgi:GNAT superfamily N-acetyltransferase
MAIEIAIVGSDNDEILASVAPGVFDDEIDSLRTLEFIKDPRHHLVVGIENGVVVGFASAIHYVHPDKPTPEMWVNEVGVAPTHRGQGIGRRLLHVLLEFGKKIGCLEAWVLTERDNVAAMRLYASVGGEASKDQVMFTFRMGTSLLANSQL